MTRRFALNRLEDETRWRTTNGSTAIYDSPETMEAIHGHGGKTVVVWID